MLRSSWGGLVVQGTDSGAGWPATEYHLTLGRSVSPLVSWSVKGGSDSSGASMKRQMKEQREQGCENSKEEAF